MLSKRSARSLTKPDAKRPDWRLSTRQTSRAGRSVLHGGGGCQGSPLSCNCSGKADGLRAPEIEHAIEDKHADGDLGGLSLIGMEAQAVAKNLRLASDLALDTNSLIVAADPSPSQATAFGNGLDVTITRRGAVSLRRLHRRKLRQRPGRNHQRPLQDRSDPRHGPWRTLEAVEFATELGDLSNNRRILEPIGNIPPAEAEACNYAQTEGVAIAA
ncbi:hypothetical protein [Azospirillum palustre]